LEQLVVGQRLGSRLAEAVPQPRAMPGIERLRPFEKRALRLRPVWRRLRYGRARSSSLRVSRAGVVHGLHRDQLLREGHSRPAGEWVNTSTPVSVTPTVCSNCADSSRSRVTAVQPSESTFTCGLPRLIIGSMVKSMPGSITA